MKLTEANRKAGIYQQQVNAKGLADGIYYYRIIALSGQQKLVDTKKMILLK